jgi:hypothetical protein
MKKITAIVILLFIASRLSAQFNVGVNINRGHEYKPITFNGWGYNILLGYSIKRKLDVNLKIDHSTWGWSAFTKDIFFYTNSFQLELKYYLIGVKRDNNPYIAVGSGYFAKRETVLFGEDGKIIRSAVGILPALGALFKLQAKKTKLYIDAKLFYSRIDYKYPTNSINFQIGLLYYLGSEKKEQ